MSAKVYREDSDRILKRVGKAWSGGSVLTPAARSQQTVSLCPRLWRLICESAAATLSWVVTEWCWAGKLTTLGAASGAVAGLVAITPASGFVTPMLSINHRFGRRRPMLWRGSAET
jgi:hypothetical protein